MGTGLSSVVSANTLTTHQREEFEDGLGGDGQHHARMVFGRIDAARAEQDCEQREHERDHQHRVRIPVRRQARRLAREHVDAHRDGGELQRDVRNDRGERDEA